MSESDTDREVRVELCLSREQVRRLLAGGAEQLPALLKKLVPLLMEQR